MVRNALILLASLQISFIQLAAAKKPSCNKVGWDAGHESFTSADVGGYTDCSKACAEHKKCKSFAFSSTDCQLYNKVVKGNFIKDKTSPYTFYDATCANSASISTSIGTTDTLDTTTTTPAITAAATDATSTTDATTTTDVTSTTSAIASASSTGLICDELGYWIGDSKYQVNIISVWGHPANERTKLACYNFCKDYDGCVSYAYNIGACSLFSAPLAGNFNYSSDSRADYYDMACGAPPATADDITTTTTDGSSARTTDSFDSAATDSAAATTTADVGASTTDAPAAATTDSSAATSTDTDNATSTSADDVTYTGRPTTQIGTPASSTTSDDSAASSSTATSDASAAATDIPTTTTTSTDAAATSVSAQRFRRYHPRRKSF